jgi:DNA-binding response OmpR family regulator
MTEEHFGRDTAAKVHRILVAEDDATIGHLLTHVLGLEKFEVILVTDGGDALEHVRSRRPDAIILDAMMPGMDGYEVLQALREDPTTNDIPVLMLSSRSLDRDVVSGFNFGADDYMVKPFNPADLVIRLKRLLNPARQWDRDVKR